MFRWTNGGDEAKVSAFGGPLKELEFPFVLEELENAIAGAAPVTTRYMFGSHALYVGDKIHFILRHKDGDDTGYDNGLWVVLAEEEEPNMSVRRQFPALRPIRMFSDMVKKSYPTWVNLPEDHDQFEELALEIIGLIGEGDLRFGKVPKSKLPKKKKAEMSPAKPPKKKAAVKKPAKKVGKAPAKKTKKKKTSRR